MARSVIIFELLATALVIHIIIGTSGGHSLPDFQEMPSLMPPTTVRPDPIACTPRSGENTAPGETGQLVCHCKGKTFTPSRSSCCGDKLYDLPTNKALCCSGTAYPIETAPCAGRCGKSNTIFNRETHLCCDGKVVKFDPQKRERCCGTKLMDPQTQRCCIGTFPIPRRGAIKCCRNYGPYYPRLMTCKKAGGKTELTRTSRSFQSSTFCKQRLVTLGEGWDVGENPEDTLRISGIIEGCRIRRYPDRVSVPLIFATVTGSHNDNQDVTVQTSCDTRTVTLIVQHGEATKCLKKRKLYRYLARRILLVSVTKSAFVCEKGAAVVTLGDGDSGFLAFREPESTSQYYG